MTYAQSVQVASDIAVHFLRSNQNVSYDNVVIPFITTTWDDIQVGAVYLIENNFPCAILLSRRLSLNCFADLREISSWIIALSNHCKRVVSRFCTAHSSVRPSVSSPYAVSSSFVPDAGVACGDITTSGLSGKRKRVSESMGPPRKVAKRTDVSLASSYIFKSVSLITEDPQLFRSVLTSLFSRFYDLYHSKDLLLLESIVFPEGVVGFPDANQAKLREMLLFAFQKLRRYRNEACEAVNSVQVGTPIVVYKMLGPEWLRCDKLKNECNYWRLV